MKRADDYQARSLHLKELNDQQLKDRFWALAQELTDPLLAMGRMYTSPSIERSVLLRMGFSSLSAKDLVDRCLEEGLLGHGAGHVVFKMAKAWGLSPQAAGQRLIESDSWAEVKALFPKSEGEGKAHV